MFRHSQQHGSHIARFSGRNTLIELSYRCYCSLFRRFETISDSYDDDERVLGDQRVEANGDTARRMVIRRLRKKRLPRAESRKRQVTSSWRTGRRAVRAVAAISDEFGRVRRGSAASVGHGGASSVYVTSHN